MVSKLIHLHSVIHMFPAGLMLLQVLVFVVVLGAFVLIAVITKKVWAARLLGLFLAGVAVLASVGSILNWAISKTVLDQEDYYGDYIVQRNYFPGNQADWQYNHYRFTITEQDSIFFFITEGADVLNTYRGTIRSVAPYGSARLILDMEEPIHHVMSDNPTTYRSAWSFRLVFCSTKFHNMYFEKGEWEPIE